MVQFQDLTNSLDEQNEAQLEAQNEAQEAQAAKEANQRIIDTINQAVATLVSYQQKHQTVSVDNQKDFPDSIKTPDIQKVVDALNMMCDKMEETAPDDQSVVDAITTLTKAVQSLPQKIVIPEAPEPVEEVTVKNQPDYSGDFQNLTKAIKSIDVKPIVNVEDKPDDYTPVTKALQKVVDAINAQEAVEVPETDLSPVTEALQALQTTIENLTFPVPNYVLPFRNQDGKAVQVQLNSDNTLPTRTHNYALKLDDYTTTSVTYVGKAAIGSASSAGVWQIQKIDETTGLVITWAGGNSNFTNIWDNRATTVTYS